MFGIGAGEFILIMIVGLIVFGPSKLPEIGRSLGKMISEFRKAQAALTATIAEVDEPQNTTSSVNEKKSTDVQKTESSVVKTQSIEEVTEMINTKPISVPETKVDLSKETEVK